MLIPSRIVLQSSQKLSQRFIIYHPHITSDELEIPNTTLTECVRRVTLAELEWRTQPDANHRGTTVQSRASGTLVCPPLDLLGPNLMRTIEEEWFRGELRVAVL